MSERDRLGPMMPVYCSGVDAGPLEQAVHVPELKAHVLGAQAAAAAAAHAQAPAQQQQQQHQQQQLAQQVENGIFADKYIAVADLLEDIFSSQMYYGVAAHAQAPAQQQQQQHQQQQLAQQVENEGSHAGSSGRSRPSGVSGAAGTELKAHVLGAQPAAAAAAHAQAPAQQQQQQHQQQQLAQQVENEGSHAGSSGRSAPSGMSGAAGTEANPSKLFVGGLSWQTSSEKLRWYFGFFGPVTDAFIVKDPITQRSRGFGFVTFQEAASAEKVLKVPIHLLDGVVIVPEHATPDNRPKRPNRAKRIFVGGVSQDTSADEVKAYFGRYGTVEETVMMVDQRTKRHRGFGFVTFVNEESADSVCKIQFHTVKNKKVECRRAQPKEAVGSSVGLIAHPTRGYSRYVPYTVPAPAPAAYY